MNEKDSMKLSFVVPVPIAGDDYTEFSHRLEVLSDLGYDGAELAIQDPKKIDSKKVSRLLKRYNLLVSAIATGSAFTKENLYLSADRSSIREKAIGRIKDQIDFASSFGAKVIIGLMRGTFFSIDPLTRQEENTSVNARKKADASKMILQESLHICGAYAREMDVELVLEAINRYETAFLHTVGETVRFIKKGGLKNTKVLADVFHMNLEEQRCISAVLREAGPYLGHIHIADNNRMAPGQGCMDFRKIIEALKAVEYSGFMTAEIVPLVPDFDMAAKQTIEHIASLDYI